MMNRVNCTVVIHLSEGRTWKEYEELEARLVPRAEIDRARSTYAVTQFAKSGSSARHIKKVITDCAPTREELELDERVKIAVEEAGIGTIEITYKHIPNRYDPAPSALHPSWQLNEGMLTEVCDLPLECPDGGQ